MTHKYVDDATLSEIFAKSATSHMQIYCDEVLQQSEQARMNINGRKTKEMLIGSSDSEVTTLRRYTNLFIFFFYTSVGVPEVGDKN